MTQSPGKYSDDRCKMRKTNGDPCESPALKGESFCHYHKLMGSSPVEFENQLFPSTDPHRRGIGDPDALRRKARPRRVDANIGRRTVRDGERFPCSSSIVTIRRTGCDPASHDCHRVFSQLDLRLTLEFRAHHDKRHQARAVDIGPAVPVAELDHDVAGPHDDVAAIEQ